MICSGAAEPVEVGLTLSLGRHPDARTRLSIEGPGVADTVELDTEPTARELRVSASPGANRFRLHTEGEPADDGRVLALRIAGRAALA